MPDIDWKSALKAVAPTLATAVLGPLGGMAVQAIGTALGIDKPTQDAIKQSLVGMSPEQAASLKQAEIAFQTRLKELEIDLERINAEDRASARSREVAVRDYVPGILAIGVTGGFFGILTWMLHYGVPREGGDALLVMLGALGTAWTAIVSYYFGSSAGSAAKDKLLAGKP